MPQLYVANATKQIVQFAYRMLGLNRLIVQPIPIGGQVRIAPSGSRTDLTPAEIDEILGQHRKYGIMDIKELETDKRRCDICFSIGEPVSSEKLETAMRRNESALEELGRQLRTEAALAVNSRIEGQIGAPLRNLEMSFVEEEPRGGYDSDLNHVAEGVRVTRGAPGVR